MSYLVQRHLVDVLHHTVHLYHSFTVGLCDTHFTAGEVGNEHTKGDGHEQQRLVLLHNAQIEQGECEKIHDEEEGVLRNVGERRHVIYLV